MILNISIKNFRSFKDEVIFSMVAESSKSKEHNIFIQPISKGTDEIRILNSALIYGANASGKSNVLRGLFDIIKLITKNQQTGGEKIIEYDPFQFDQLNINAPVEFYIEFVGKDEIKYKYELHFVYNEVVKEELIYWPNSKPEQLFTRFKSNDINSLIHWGQLGPSLENTKFEIFKNQTFLSKFGKDLPNDIISKVYIYLDKIVIINACSFAMMEKAKAEVSNKMTNDMEFEKKINELLKFADTGLEGVSVRKIEKDKFKFPETFPLEERNKIINRNLFSMSGIHALYYKSQFVDNVYLPFNQESNGTRALYTLGGKMLDVLAYGGILLVDELETSFHSYLAKILIRLFQNKRINSKNAQLIFTTHDTNLLDRTLFRKDQVWFTEKNNFGVTELYSLQDFSEVKEDTPFDKWYLAGKFGGLPNLKSIESLFIS